MRRRIVLMVDMTRTRSMVLAGTYRNDDPFYLFHLLTGQVESPGTVEKRERTGIRVEKNLLVIEVNP